jgi:hypothetical protein
VRAVREKEGWLLLGVLLLALLHGLAYVFLVPPGQHYAAPSHFEYAWLLAQRGALLQPGAPDALVRRQIAQSMLANGFFENLDYRPDFSDPNALISIGYSQLDDPPFYYLLASLPLRVAGGLSVEGELYLARLVSLGLFLLTVLAGWGMAADLFPVGHPLRWLLPLTMALLPGYVDLMTAVNNDVGAAAVFTLFLWGSVRLLRRGVSLGGLVWVLGTAVLCTQTKPTVVLALPLSGVVLLFALLRGRWRRLAWGLFFAGGVFLIGALFSLQEAALWYRATAQPQPTRLSTSLAPLGGHVLQVDTRAQVTPRWMRPLQQPLPLQSWQGLAGKKVTLGAWVWASAPAKVRAPVLNHEKGALQKEIDVSTVPAFYAFSAALPPDAGRVWVTLSPLSGEGEITVYYDGLVLAAGDYPPEEIPRFDDDDGNRGTWGGQPFENLVRNASAERAWPALRPWAESLGTRLLPDGVHPSLILFSLFDWSAASWYYRFAAENLLRTFWAAFGWGHVHLLVRGAYRLLAAATAVGLLGALAYLLRKWRLMPKALLLLAGLTLVGIWGGALARGVMHVFSARVFIPAARYAYPAIVPTLFTLVGGWYVGLRFVAHRLSLPQPALLALYVFAFLTLDAVSLISVLRFYA